MQQAMQRHAAVFRSSQILTEGCSIIDSIADRMDDISISDSSMIWNTDMVEGLELGNLMSQALVTIRSAEQRHESRGAHAHEDHPDRDDKKWMKHTVMWLDEKNKTTLGYRPVHMNTLSNEVETVPPVARVY
jgi:succinate dehydrogenase / fumarate reductase flavoprotein subunit